MGLIDQHGEVEFPFSKKTVFKAVMEAAPKLKGLVLDSADELSGRFTFKADASWASWGEVVPVQLIQISPTCTQMKIMSTPKIGVVSSGAVVFGKNRKNIENIINAVSKVLSKYPTESEEKVSNVDFADQLIKLKTLLNQGVLTEEEFNKQKQIIIEKETIASSHIESTTKPQNSNQYIYYKKQSESKTSLIKILISLCIAIITIVIGYVIGISMQNFQIFIFSIILAFVFAIISFIILKKRR